VTRRTLLRGAAGGSAMIGGAGLPAWARPVPHLPPLRRPDSLPFLCLPAGHSSMPKIEHIVVLMMENHSFDNLLGMAPHQVLGRSHVDGFTRRGGRLRDFNPDPSGRRIYAAPAASPCQLPDVPSQSWNASQGQRYFCSVLAQTYPNRRFLFTGSSSGSVDDKQDALVTPTPNGTLWDRFDAHHVNWQIYSQGSPSALIVPTTFTPARSPRLNKIDRFYADATAGRLPALSFLDPDCGTTSEESPGHPGRRGPWRRWPGGFDRYGFRVPMIVVSPWARARYVSSVVQDHTSIAAFIERKWKLPAMTFRDADAAPMTDYFDFRRPAFAHPPRLAAAPGLAPGLAACHAQGLAPPLPPAGA